MTRTAYEFVTDPTRVYTRKDMDATMQFAQRLYTDLQRIATLGVLLLARDGIRPLEGTAYTTAERREFEQAAGFTVAEALTDDPEGRNR